MRAAQKSFGVAPSVFPAAGYCLSFGGEQARARALAWLRARLHAAAFDAPWCPPARLLVRHRFGVHGFVKKKLDAAGLPHKKFFGFLDYQVTRRLKQQRAGERSCAAARARPGTSCAWPRGSVFRVQS